MATTPTDPDNRARLLAQAARAVGDATGWFEQLYAEAARGEATVPWGHRAVNPYLAAWTSRRRLDGAGRPALVVGCGLGDDAEHLAGQGYWVTAFDVAPSAVKACWERFPASTVDYRVADVLDPPAEWARAFDLVVEAYTVQTLTGALRRRAAENIGGFLAPGGTLLVIAFGRTPEEPEDPEEPTGRIARPLTVAELDAFTVTGLRREHLDDLPLGGDPPVRRLVATFTRP